MKSPYEILEIKQDSNKQEILKATKTAMMKRVYTLAEITVAQKQLLDPHKRLAVDFLFPTKIKVKRPQFIDFEFSYVEAFDINDFDENYYDSIGESK